MYPYQCALKRREWEIIHFRKASRISGRRIFVFWSGSLKKEALIYNKPNYYFYSFFLSFLALCFLLLIYLHHISTAFSVLLELSVSIFSVSLLPLPRCCQHFLRAPCSLCRCPQSGMTQTWPPPPPHLLPVGCLPISSLSNFRSSFWLLS